MSGEMVADDAADLSQLLSSLVHYFMCCGDATILSGHGVGVGRHTVLGRCVCIVGATGLGQLPSCIVRYLMLVEGVTTRWYSARHLSVHSMSSVMHADEASDLSQLLS